MKVYYSRMNKTPEHTVLEDIRMLSNAFGEKRLSFHGGGQYDSKKLLASKIVVVTGYNGDFVGKGVFSEINTAIFNGIPVFKFNPLTIAITFKRINKCVTNDVNDYFLKYGICDYRKIGSSSDFLFTLNTLVETYGTKFPMDDKNDYCVVDEDEEEEEYEDDEVKLPKDKYPSLPSQVKPDPDDFDSDTNMMY